jgi:hypothetical protein
LRSQDKLGPTVITSQGGKMKLRLSVLVAIAAAAMAGGVFGVRTVRPAE